MVFLHSPDPNQEERSRCSLLDLETPSPPLSAPRRPAGSITHLSVSCDMFSLPPWFFLVKLDFQVGAGNRESELPEVGLQVSRLFFFLPSHPLCLSPSRSLPLSLCLLPPHLPACQVSQSALCPAAANDVPPSPSPRLFAHRLRNVLVRPAVTHLQPQPLARRLRTFHTDSLFLTNTEMFSPGKKYAAEGRILPPPIGFLGAERRHDWLLAEGKQVEGPPPHLLSIAIVKHLAEILPFIFQRIEWKIVMNPTSELFA